MSRAWTGAVVPHAPLLLPDVGDSRGEVALERARAASRAVALHLTGTLVVVSPHARRTGVYTSSRAGLRGFGVPLADATDDVDRDVSARVASGWGRPALDAPLDHGILVPLALLSWTDPVVAIGIAEDEPDVPGAARSLSESLISALGSKGASVVASANGGAGVTPRGPLTELPQGLALEEGLRSALETDPASLEELAPRLASDGGSCALGPLLVLAHLFRGRPMEVMAHEWPYGVGYPVAVTRESA